LKEDNEEVKPKPRKRSKSTEMRISKDIQEHFRTPEQVDILRKFPEKLLRKKIKTPEHLYIADPNTAKIISKYLIQDVVKEKPFLEINPGLGLLTKELLDNTENKILLFEAEEKFAASMKVILKSFSKCNKIQ
jgi:dimethyladenosine transferase 2